MIIKFTSETKYGLFSDALILADDHNFTEQEIEAMKQQRIDNYVTHIDNSQFVVVEPTQEPDTVVTEEPTQEPDTVVVEDPATNTGDSNG